jgi:hypothetical protein
MLGYWICRLAQKDWSVWGVHWRNPIRISGAKAIQADLTIPSKRQMLFDDIGPGAVIHAAAISNKTLYRRISNTSGFSKRRTRVIEKGVIHHEVSCSRRVYCFANGRHVGPTRWGRYGKQRNSTGTGTLAIMGPPRS